jgi:hypothetical protein
MDCAPKEIVSTHWAGTHPSVRELFTNPRCKAEFVEHMLANIDLDDRFAPVFSHGVLSGSFGGRVVVNFSVLMESVVIDVGSPSELADVTLRVMSQEVIVT